MKKEVIFALIAVIGTLALCLLGQGFVFKSPDGTRWRITVDNSVALYAEQL